MKRLLRRPALEMPRLGLPAFRLRILVRGVFVLLALATVVLSVVVLKDEKSAPGRLTSMALCAARPRSWRGCATPRASWRCSMPATSARA